MTFDATLPDHALLSRPDETDVLARVTRVNRSTVDIVTVEGDELTVARDRMPAMGPVTGDWVWTRYGDIVASVERSSELRRASTVRSTQVLAANVNLVLLVIDAARASRARLVERLAAIGWDSGSTPLIVVTKSDTIDADQQRELEMALMKNAPGIEWLFVSSTTGEGIAELLKRFTADTTAVLIGQSGVGKSTLLNMLLGSERQATGGVRERDGKGRHTTTSRELIQLADHHGCIIDTPGVRELGVTDSDSVEQVFAEIVDAALRCRFADCEHVSEPACAVLEAVASGAVSSERLGDYRALQRELEHTERRSEPNVRDKNREWNRLSREYRKARGH